MHRRAFFGSVFSGTAASARPPKLKAGDIPMCVLGKTGQKLTRTGMGGARSQLIPFEDAEAGLEKSLKLMRTDYVDLWQIRGVGPKEEIERITGPGGALEAFVAAKKAGKCRFIGFPGHSDPGWNVAMLRAYDGFDTLLMPLRAPTPAASDLTPSTVPRWSTESRRSRDRTPQ